MGEVRQDRDAKPDNGENGRDPHPEQASVQRSDFGLELDSKVRDLPLQRFEALFNLGEQGFQRGEPGLDAGKAVFLGVGGHIPSVMPGNGRTKDQNAGEVSTWDGTTDWCICMRPRRPPSIPGMGLGDRYRPWWAAG